MKAEMLNIIGWKKRSELPQAKVSCIHKGAGLANQETSGREDSLIQLQFPTFVITHLTSERRALSRCNTSRKAPSTKTSATLQMVHRTRGRKRKRSESEPPPCLNVGCREKWGSTPYNTVQLRMKRLKLVFGRNTEKIKRLGRNQVKPSTTNKFIGCRVWSPDPIQPYFRPFCGWLNSRERDDRPGLRCELTHSYYPWENIQTTPWVKSNTHHTSSNLQRDYRQSVCRMRWMRNAGRSFKD